MPVSSLKFVPFVVIAALAGCSAGTVDGPGDAQSGDDVNNVVDSGLDARTTDVPSVDTGAVVDTGTDTGNVVDVVSPPVDTGVYCPSTCSTNAECQSGCPAPATGYHYCCQYGSGGGSCSQQASACDNSTTGVGDLGSACSMDSDCHVGAANCCVMIGSAGTCGCTGSFGCQPAPLCN